MDKLKNVVIGVLAVALLLTGSLYLKAANLGGITYSKEDFPAGLFAGRGRQFNVSNVGVLTSSGVMTLSGALTQSGASTFSGTVDITAELQAARVINGGGVLAIGSVATSGPSAAQVCNNAGATLAMTASSGAMTFASGADFFSDCLESDGKSVFWKISNLGPATSSAQLVAGVSTTLVADADLGAHDADLLTGGQSMLLEFYRESATNLVIFVHSKFADSD